MPKPAPHLVATLHHRKAIGDSPTQSGQIVTSPVPFGTSVLGEITSGTGCLLRMSV
jgi:hypothetical protein